VAAELGMDRAQMSRLVWRLADQGYVTTLPGEGDRRRNTLTLLKEGEEAFAMLDMLSDESVETMLRPLDAGQCQQLLASMQQIEALLMKPQERVALTLRPHRIGELGWLIHRQAILYNAEYGWNGEFEALIARIYAEFEEASETPPKGLWVAERGGRIAGSVFVLAAPEDAATARLRMLYVEPAFRGLGLGRMLVDQAVAFARSSGYARMTLWTQDCLASARRIYQAAGFVLASEAPHRSFGKDLNGQTWQLDLSPQ
jgi:GNAT superfamily N-acetyltransferase